MPHIVAATDFSSRSQRAFRRAGLLARQTGAELTLVRGALRMRFILIRASSADALRAAAVAGAQLLPVGEALHWPELTGSSCFVVPLFPDTSPSR